MQCQGDGLCVGYIGEIHRHCIASVGVACDDGAASGHSRLAVDQVSVKGKDKGQIAARAAALHSLGAGKWQVNVEGSGAAVCLARNSAGELHRGAANLIPREGEITVLEVAVAGSKAAGKELAIGLKGKGHALAGLTKP